MTNIETYIAKCIYIYCTSMINIGLDNTEEMGITLPKSILERIDNQRGDIPRSRFIRKVIESYFKGMDKI
jgi:hypothetical protein